MQVRPRFRLVGRLLAAVAVTIAVASGVSVWLTSSGSRGTEDRRPEVIAQHPSPGATVPSEMADPSGRPTHDAAAPRAIAMSPSSVVEMTGTLPAATNNQSIDVMYRISFEFASDRINAESKQILDEIVVAMEANPSWRLMIEGHTDAYGTAAHNQALSESRAQAASAYLQSAGIGAERLSARGFGASRPLEPSTTLGNVRNRRVELRRQ